MNVIEALSRNEMKAIRGGCGVSRITITINGDCFGTVRCDGESYHMDCCSDFGRDVGWCIQQE